MTNEQDSIYFEKDTFIKELYFPGMKKNVDVVIIDSLNILQQIKQINQKFKKLEKLSRMQHKKELMNMNQKLEHKNKRITNLNITLI